jgi:trehalose-6-phosphate synthase
MEFDQPGLLDSESHVFFQAPEAAHFVSCVSSLSTTRLPLGPFGEIRAITILLKSKEINSTFFPISLEIEFSRNRDLDKEGMPQHNEGLQESLELSKHSKSQ